MVFRHWFVFWVWHMALLAQAGTIGLLTAPEVGARFSEFTIVDARKASAYEAGHLPGAQPMEWEDWTLQKPGVLNYVFGNPAKWGQVPTPDAALEKRLQDLGLSNDKPVLVVGAPQVYGEEGRIAWNLLYWGAERVFLLNGGFSAWEKAYPKRIETGSAGKASRGNFTIRLDKTRLAERTDVLALVSEGSAPILDARTPEEFAGKAVSGQKRGGHVPNARLIPFSSLYDQDGFYLSKTALKERVGTLPPQPIAYCVGGVRSALLVLLIEARLGVRAANYAGSMWEWAADKTAPLVKTADTATP